LKKLVGAKNSLGTMAGKTQLIQKNISFPSQAQKAFGMRTAENAVPLVLVPADRWWCSCYYTVPSGVSCITQKFGKDCDPLTNRPDPRDNRKKIMGLTSAGLKCSPAWSQVKYCVTKQSISYEAPVKSCPTIDNVMVDCELTLVFEIGPEPEEVRNFVYKLGAPRFNEFLAAAVDEGIRQLVRGEQLKNVLELRGSSQAGVRKVMDSLNKKFKAFGVKFTRAVIKDVRLPPMLRRLLEDTTNFKTKIREITKTHEVSMNEIQYNEERDGAELDKQYERIVQDLENDMKVALIDREKMKVKAQEKRQVNIIRVQEEAATQETRANADKNVATTNAQKEVEGIKADVEARTEAAKIAAVKDAQVRVEESEAMVEVAQKNADALLQEAGAEDKAKAGLKSVREWELEMAKCEVNEAIARKSKIVIAGATGERLVDSFCNPNLYKEGGIVLEG